ncbi:MAG: TRAP dicarboxylate transporter, DctM subunit [Synergistales bacterium 54_9]|jgi:tripartite ATP-independent transporter DctM subunit|nr:MAG: TRAP dicarboxylate transporter, DctM subunit [Synergistales bacterium 54_9]MDN5336309.1 C4-dicarboxylate transporter, DctM subunit [Synergistales bacterium]HAG22561.1 C4-dicarboxylate ABC transporter permease [Synergistaceae bacterium]
MLWVMLGSMLFLLVLGFPMMVPLIVAPLLVVATYLKGFDPMMLIQQILAGIRPLALIAVPMFIFAADVITTGQVARRLIDFVMAFLGHIRGGLAVTTTAACTFFGAVSGSTQATVVAIGETMRPFLLEDGYDDSFNMALIINAAGIALLIPPSISMIIYGVVTGSSVGELFIAGVGPGILVFVLFSAYCYVASRRMGVKQRERFDWGKRLVALKRGLVPLGFPAIILGGIYSGYFSPTEAAAVSVLYAVIVESFVYKHLKLKDYYRIALSTGLVTAVVFILVAMGAAFSWLVAFTRIPDMLLPPILGADPTIFRLLIVIAVSYFIACMFVDSIVAIMILSPIFAPWVSRLGIDPVLVGVLVTMQAAIGAVTPPFGCNIFTAMAVFRRPYIDVVRRIAPFLVLYIIATLMVILFPDIALFLRDMAFR